MDLSKEGLSMFFKPWQLKVLQTLWMAEDGMSSSEVSKSVGADLISRSSIIFFLDDATQVGLVEKRMKLGRGGKRGIYRAKLDEAETMKYLKEYVRELLTQL